MNEIIKINSDNKVSGRELHDFLEVGTAYKDWFPRMVEYGFTEGIDFCSKMSESTGGRDFTTWMKQMIGYGFSEHTDYETCSPNLGSEIHGGQNKIDYRMTIDMAKEIHSVLICIPPLAK